MSAYPAGGGPHMVGAPLPPSPAPANKDVRAPMPFDRPSLEALLRDFPSPSAAATDAARARQSALTKPPGSLGRLEEAAVWLAGWQGVERPVLDRVEVLVFAGNHGVCARGVSPYPSSVTAQMVANFRSGGAAINQLSRLYGAALSVIGLDLDRPTGDFAEAPAMTEADCLDAIGRGAAAVPDAADLLLLGEMGIGNTTVAAALCCALYGGDPADWVGPGTGADAPGIARKAEAVAAGLHRHRTALGDPFEVLRRLGGREQAALAGAILAARRRSIPVLLDGFVCCAAAAVAERLAPGGLDHCLAGHRSAEPAHGRLLGRLGLSPLLDLDMRLGEATGAAVALGVLRGAVACHAGMATFAEARVDDRSAGSAPPTEPVR